ncbi:MAG TPA: hypothetical protein VK956_15790 [Verrucomicrobium sp.]|nr:hypothetical protein [Verrucomicrobium sp.]
MPQASRHPAGSALVITVIILALITIMVLGYANLVRNETVASGAHLDRSGAQAYAQMGVDMVTGVLRHHTADTGKVWASQPGAVLVPVENATGSALIRLGRRLPLHSGLPSAAALALDPADPLAPVNLNVQTFNDQAPATHVITDQRTDPANPGSPIATMPLRWVYVRADGTLDDSETPSLTNSTNPLVGRFAWWADDEGTKININTAWKRNAASGTGVKNPFATSHPASINLLSLMDFGMTTAMVDMLHLKVAPDPYDFSIVNRFFNSPRELRALDSADGSFTSVLNDAKFEVTHYNHEPDTTFFNEPRIVLTTDKTKAAGRPFIDIKLAGAPEIWDPIAHTDPTKLADTVDLLNSYLKREDWPVAPESSFQQKFYANKKERLTQLSLNIINYVRSRESAGEPQTKVVVPLRGEQAAGGRFQLMEIATSSIAYIGITRTPKITEMGLWIAQSPTSGTNYSAKFKLEIHLPKNFGLDQIDLTKISLYLSAAGTGLSGNPTEKTITTAEIEGGNAILAAGGYASITRTATVSMTGSRPNVVNLRYAIARTRRLDVTPLGTAAPCTLDGIGVADKDITSIEVDDPRVNSHRNDWKRRDSGNSFGRENDGKVAGARIRTLGQPSIYTPRQDTNSSGDITDASLYMPPPAGSAGNLSGQVDSVGELGYIHTGMESGAGAGVPLRTLRLQPNEDALTMVPDWAFMDLFTVPVDVPARARGMFAPHATSTAGRINVNAMVQPYGDPLQVGAPLERSRPLIALLMGVAAPIPSNPGETVSLARAKTIAKNLYNRTLASKGKKYGYADAYDSPGEIVEIAGVSDGGEESEAVMRGIANLISTRSSVFTVFTVGQTLKQTRNGALAVTAEIRQQTMLERYADPSDTGKTRFRRIEYIPLTP